MSVHMLHLLQSSTFPQMVLGRVTAATGIYQVCYFLNLIHLHVVIAFPVVQSPLNNRTCVYYEVTCEEEYQNWSQDKDGNRNKSTSWKTRFTEIRAIDFLLTDPQFSGVTVYVPALQVPVKLHSDANQVNLNQGQQGLFSFGQSQVPPSILALCQRNNFNPIINTASNIMHQDGPTGNVRYHEKSFDLNEQIAVLGLVSDSVFNSIPVKMMQPISQQSISEQFFKQENWDDWDQKAWKKLTEKPAIILTDDSALFQNQQVATLRY